MLPRALRLHPKFLKKRLSRQISYVFPLEIRQYVFPDFQNKWFVRVSKTVVPRASDRNRARRLIHEAIIKVSQKENPACYEIVLKKPLSNATAPQIFAAVNKLIQMSKQS